MLPFPSPGELPDPGIELWSPALQAGSIGCDWFTKQFRCSVSLVISILVFILVIQKVVVSKSPSIVADLLTCLFLPSILSLLCYVFRSSVVRCILLCLPDVLILLLLSSLSLVTILS